MNRIWMIGAMALALLALPADRAEAQAELGVQGLYNTDAVDESGEGVVGIGGRLGVGLPMVGLGVSGDFNWYFPDCAAECESWELLGNVTYSILDVLPVTPYFGAGLAYQSASFENSGVDIDSNETGVNLLGGVALGGMSPLNAYGEISYRMMDEFDDQLVLGIGILF